MKTAFEEYVNDKLKSNVQRIEYYLLLEKQQIIDAWNDGNTEAKFDDGIGCNSNDYYAIKFNNCKD